MFGFSISFKAYQHTYLTLFDVLKKTNVHVCVLLAKFKVICMPVNVNNCTEYLRLYSVHSGIYLYVCVHVQRSVSNCILKTILVVSVSAAWFLLFRVIAAKKDLFGLVLVFISCVLLTTKS